MTLTQLSREQSLLDDGQDFEEALRIFIHCGLRMALE
jgi:hypothetical protein